MNVPIKRTDKNAALPDYKSAGAAAMECTARRDVAIAPNTGVLVPLNIALKPPRGHFVLLAARSSLHKRGLMMANGVGIGDEDFSGNNDEYQAVVYNYTADKITVERGDRIAQMILLPF